MQQGYLEDDDPFYEILNCHKVSLLEQRLSNPINQFEKIYLPKEDVDFMIQTQWKRQQKGQNNNRKEEETTVNQKVIDKLHPVFESFQIVDEEEIKTYEDYMRSPFEIPSKGTLDYHAQIDYKDCH